VKKTFWLREFVSLLKDEHGDVGQTVAVLYSEGHLTLHLVTQLLRMFIEIALPTIID